MRRARSWTRCLAATAGQSDPDGPRSRPLLTGRGPKRAPLACERMTGGLGGNAIGLWHSYVVPRKTEVWAAKAAGHALDTSRGVCSESAKERSASAVYPGNGPVLDPATGLRPGRFWHDTGNGEKRSPLSGLRWTEKPDDHQSQIPGDSLKCHREGPRCAHSKILEINLEPSFETS